MYCPFAAKATSTTLIFIECTRITFHTTNLRDDVHKEEAVFTGLKLCANSVKKNMYLFIIPLIY